MASVTLDPMGRSSLCEQRVVSARNRALAQLHSLSRGVEGGVEMDPSSGRGAGVIQNLSCNIRASRGGNWQQKKNKKNSGIRGFSVLNFPAYAY